MSGESRPVRCHGDLGNARARRKAAHEFHDARAEERLAPRDLDACHPETANGPADCIRQPAQIREGPIGRLPLESGPAVTAPEVAAIRDRDAERNGAVSHGAVPRFTGEHRILQRTALRTAVSISFWMSPGICMFFMNAQFPASWK